MTENAMSAGDFVRLCGKWSDMAFYFSSSEQRYEDVDLRVRFTEVTATLCPNLVVFRNECGDSMTVRDVRSVRVEENVLAGLGRITMVSGSGRETSCMISRIKISKRH